MANYKVSYKVLSQQGETVKAIAKEVDGYASRLDQIRGKLGDDDLLRQVRVNLQKLSQQLGESRAVLNMAGEVVEKCVEGYTGTEKAVVKKVDRVRAHNRDFYKNPVAVASAGGAAAAAAPGAASAAAAQASVNISGGAAPGAAPAAAAAAAAPAAGAEPDVNVTFINSETTININEAAPAAAPMAAAAPAAAAAAPAAARTAPAAAAAAAGGLPEGAVLAGAALGGAAAGAGTLFGAQKLKQFLADKHKAMDEQNGKKPAPPKPAPAAPAEPEEDPEVLLEQALEEAAKYRKPGEPAPAPVQEEEDPEVLLERALKEAAKYRTPAAPEQPAPDGTPKFGKD